jgi:Tol biopolymer transport system component
MSVSFDWDFKEEPDSLGEEDDRGRTERRRRWLFRAGLLLILLAMVGGMVGAWVKSRLNAVEKIEAELRTAVELELKTIQDGDAELYRSRQDPSDSHWETRQLARYITRPGSFAPAPGLTPIGRPLEIREVHLVGRTGRAELTQWFSATTQQPDTPLPFHVTWFYRRGDDGVWYHVAPPDDYWGLPYSWHGSRLVIRATEVESAVLDPIARDLAVLVVEGCRRLGCPEGQRYNLNFDGELAPQVQDNWWTLPALYLTGLPDGDEARAAWEHALKLWVVEALAQAQTGDSELSSRVIYRQLVKRLQAELDLAETSAMGPTTSDVNLLGEALRNGRRPGFQSLWEAQYRVSDPEEVRLLETEVVLLLRWIEFQVGRGRLYELLPALSSYERLDTALVAGYRLAPSNFETEWFAYLFYVSGFTPSSALVPRVSVGQLSPPPTPPPSSISPGDQIAFICNYRVWVGNGDGSNLVPLTARSEVFAGLHWSPDGHWLLTAWLPDVNRASGERRVLYLLPTDGSGGQLLSEDPKLPLWPGGWSPDSRQVTYQAWPGAEGSAPETWAADVETGETRHLSSLHIWSPDGRYLVYVTEPPGDGVSTVWLADANGENAHEIVDRVGVWPGGSWSPDSSRVALALYDADVGENAIFVFDLTTERLTSLATPEALAKALAAEDGFLSDGVDPAVLEGNPLQWIWIGGWSADGSRLLVVAQWEGSSPSDESFAVMAVISLDGALPRVLATGRWMGAGSAAWSPTDADRLTVMWPTRTQVHAPSGNAYLFDLKAGPIFTATQSWDASWSPDGAWLAFSGQEQVTIVDENGRDRFALGKEGGCSTAVWNPVADLSDLGATPPFVSSTSGWSFANVQVYQDSEAQAFRVYGELVNYTEMDQHLIELVPVIRDDKGSAIATDQEVVFAPGFEDLTRVVSLAEGRSVPFGFSVHLPQGVLVGNDYSVAVSVVAEPGELTRDDLDIPYDDYDLSDLPDRLKVSGLFEIPAQPLEEYAAVVATAYDQEGRVVGWGWIHRTDDRFLMSGGHYFEVEMQAVDFASELDLEVASYKVQLFGR